VFEHQRINQLKNLSAKRSHCICSKQVYKHTGSSFEAHILLAKKNRTSWCISFSGHLQASDTASPYLFVNGNTMPHTSALARFAEPFAAVLEPESLTSRAGPAKPKAIQPHENAQLRPETTPWGL